MKKILNSKLILFSLIFCILLTMLPQRANAATQDNKDAFRAELIEMLRTCDGTEHTNLYKYRLTKSDVTEIVESIKNDPETKLLYKSYDFFLYSYCKMSGSYLKSFQFMYMNSNAPELYQNMVTAYNEIMAGVDSNMSQLELLLYFHDEIVSRVSYSKDGTSNVYGANGALGKGVAVCMGYDDALTIFLDAVGIEYRIVSQQETLNHEWLYVKIDGEWYHVDTTWDRTRSGSKTEGWHYFLLRNDKEFATAGSSTHGNYNWTLSEEADASTSTRFTKWFVHNVRGKMYYYNGFWYYRDKNSNSLMKALIDGTQKETVVDGSAIGTTSIVSVQNGILEFTVDGVATSKVIDASATQEEGSVADDAIAIPELSAVETTPAEAAAPVEDVTPVETTAPIEEVPVETTAPSEESAIVVTEVKNGTTYWNDISSWRTGNYSQTTAAYAKSSSRICLNDYIKASGNATYTLELSDSSLRVVIRELNASQELIASTILSAGKSIVTNENTRYLAVSVYNPQNTALTFSDYEAMFHQDGFTIGLNGYTVESNTQPEETVQPVETPAEPVVTEAPVEDPVVDSVDEPVIDETINDSGITLDHVFDLSNLSDWITGTYHITSGKYQTYNSRICLPNYLATGGSNTFTVTLSTDAYRLVIREMDESLAVITSHNLSDGRSFTTDPNCRYLAVSLYSPKEDKLISYDTYVELFATEGFCVKLSESTVIDDIGTPLVNFVEVEDSWSPAATVFAIIGFATLFSCLVYVVGKKRRQRL